MNQTKIQAHRGAAAYLPENTLEAFDLAICQGADMIELDVHLTKDNQVVVAHDERIDRVSNGKGFIKDYTLSELKKFNFNKEHPEAIDFCQIPTLAEVYELIAPTNLGINCELKTTQLFYPGLTEKVVKLAKEYDLTDRLLYSSFNHYSLLELRAFAPEAKIGLLYELGMVDPWVYANYVKATAIHPQFFIIASLPETVQKCHEAGIEVNVWVPDDIENINKMLVAGVDGIITNKPDLALAAREDFLNAQS